ncbi:MAG TPA: glycosyltransferase family 87 protein [Rhizomicrobium sp.]|nr:glycosyltransferase family 87 protein [Rhizomicrobium sp.]
MKKIFLLARTGDFLTRERMMLWAGGLVLGLAFCVLYLAVTAHGLNDYAGRPLGTDFSNVYAAGVAAAHGDPTAPFDPQRQLAAERAIFGPETPFYGWHYPPFFLFVAAALAQLGYIHALIVWQGVSLLLYLGAMSLLLRRSAAPAMMRDRLWLLLTLGFSAVFVNLIHGQNGFLTTALFAAGLAVLDERPFFSGVLFGLLCYKPQFCVLIPILLLATGRWRCFGAAAATVAGLSAAATASFGWQVWPAFLESMTFTRTVVLEQGNTGFHKIQSIFAWVRMWHGPVPLAYGAQIAVAVMVIFALLRIWRASIAIGYKKAALCVAALLITPYCLDYDLMLLAPAIALLAAEGKNRGFFDYEILCLAILWLMPIATRNFAHATSIPLAVPAMLFCFTLIYRRCGARSSRGNAMPVAKIVPW